MMGEPRSVFSRDDLFEGLMVPADGGADPVDAWLTEVRSPQSSAAPSQISHPPPTPPLPVAAGTAAFPLSPRPSPRAGATHSHAHAFPSPSAARRGCFGPRHNGVAYPLPRSRAAARDDGDADRARRRRSLERGSRSVPTHLLHDLQVPPIELPGTLHGVGGGAAMLARGPYFKQEPVADVSPHTHGASAAGLFGGLLIGGNMGTGGGGASSSTGTGGQVAVGSGESGSVGDWEDVTRRPLILESDGRVFEVPADWAARFRRVRELEERYAMLEELERLGKAFVEDMKKERSDAYYARMHAIRDLSASTKVTIRGRIHSKLNPFVKEQHAKVNKEITLWLLRQIPLQ